MLSDIVWRGAFHRNIISTIGGMTATPARTVQLVTEFWFPAMPAINAADSQTAARAPLSDTSCMPEEYALSLNGAVPECTRRPRRSDRAPQAILLLAVAGCARVHALRRVCTSAQTVGLWKCKDRDTPRKDPGYGEIPMLFIAGLVIVSVLIVIIPRMRATGGVNAAPLGWMSEQWLAEHRASHSL